MRLQSGRGRSDCDLQTTITAWVLFTCLNRGPMFIRSRRIPNRFSLRKGFICVNYPVLIPSFTFTSQSGPSCSGRRERGECCRPAFFLRPFRPTCVETEIGGIFPSHNRGDSALPRESHLASSIWKRLCRPDGYRMREPPSPLWLN